MEPFERSYQKLSTYFRNGTPLDKTFEYYTLISDITTELKNFRKNESENIVRKHLKSIVPFPDEKEKIKQLNPKLDQTTKQFDPKKNKKPLKITGKTNPLDTRPRTAKEINSRVLSDRVFLLLNYASEIDEFKSIGNGNIFNPGSRATRDQMSEIGLFSISSSLSNEMKN
jgi:hypothetical protein